MVQLDIFYLLRLFQSFLTLFMHLLKSLLAKTSRRKQNLVTTDRDIKKEMFVLVLSLHGPTRHSLLVASFPIVFDLVHAPFKIVRKDVTQGW